MAFKYLGKYTIKSHTNCDVKQFSGVAFFPSISCVKNRFYVYFFLAQNVRFIWGAMEEIGLSKLSNLTLLSQSGNMLSKEEYWDLVTAIGFKTVLKLQDNSTNNVCFKHLVIQFGQRLAPNFTSIRERFTKEFGSAEDRCPSKRVCIVQRNEEGHFRRILNIDA